MAWFFRRRGKHAQGQAEEAPVTAVAGYPRFDSGGRPIVEFSPDVRHSLGLEDGILTSLAAIYRGQAAVRICVDFIANNIAHCKLKVYRRTPDGREEVPATHPLRSLLENPNARVSGYEFMRDTIADYAVYGNGYWAKRQVGNARALVRVHPCYVHPRGGSPVAGPTTWIIDVGGGPVELDPTEVVTFRDYNPEDVRVGVSALESLMSLLAEEKDTQIHRRKYLRNASRNEGIIQRPLDAGNWTREQRQDFRSDWQDAMAGLNNSGKAAILEDGMEWKPMGFSPKDSEFIEGRQFGLDMVATAYHIPLAALSRGGTFTFASMKEFHTIVYVDTLGPRMAQFEKAINTQLVPDYQDPDLFVEFNIEEKLQGDFETQADAMRKAIQVPYMSVNEGRRLRNLPPVGDPDFNEPAKPTNYSYATQPAPPQVVRQAALDPLDAPSALDAELAAELEESTNGHH